MTPKQFKSGKMSRTEYQYLKGIGDELTVTIVGNRIGDPSSNTGRSCLRNKLR